MAVYRTLAISESETESLRRRASRPDALAAYYRSIGDTLNICEASSLSVGVPWLPPSDEVRKLNRRFSPPVADFVRLSLVGISTTVIELYCDDLENLQNDEVGLQRLYIRHLSLLERYSLLALLVVALTSLGFLFSIWLKLTLPAILFTLVIIASTAIAVGLSLASDAQRRASFHCLLYNELLRRRGLDRPNSNRVRIMPIESKPLSK